MNYHTADDRSGVARRRLVTVTMALVLACTPGILFAQTQKKTISTTGAQLGSNEPMNLTIGQAVKEALSNSKSVTSAISGWRSAQDKALEAKLQMIPSVTLAGSYTRLSDLPGGSFDLGPLGTITLPASPDNSIVFGVDVQYPIFAGFRLREAAKLAELQSLGKKVGIDIVRRAVIFEVRRAYWQAVRAGANVTTMKENLKLVHVILQEVQDQVKQGLATQSNLLSAQDRYNEAQLMLTDAVSQRNRAYLALASFLGKDAIGKSLAGSGTGGFSAEATPAFSLSSDPASSQFPALSGKLDPTQLVTDALANRPEAQTAAIGVAAAQHAAGAARGGLYPTVAITGDYTYANPNQRVFPATAKFTGTWDVGVHLSFNVGKLPATVAAVDAAVNGVDKAKADEASARTKITLDVRNTLLAYEQAQQDVAMTRSMVKQADENLRVTKQKYENGVAKHSDVLQAELSLLRAQFAVTNKEIDLRIAAADLVRAAALPAN